MAITLTGSKYTGAVSSYSNGTLAITGASLVASDFTDTQRIVAIFNSANNFKGIAYVRSALTASMQLEYDAFDPATKQKITITNTDVFNVSLNLSELAVAGLSVTNSEVIVSDAILFGTAGDERSLCLYDEDKDLRQTAGGQWETLGGVVVFSHLLSSAGTEYANPVNMVFNDGGVRFKTGGTSAHFFWLGGSLIAQATPAYFGGYGTSNGNISNGSLVFSNIKNTDMDFIATNIGATWTANSSRHILRECFVTLAKVNAIGIRWANGVVEGGGAKLRTTLPLAVFGSVSSNRIAVGANTDKRYVVYDIAGNSVFDSGGGMDATNLICSDRSSARNTSAIHNYYWNNSYTNIIEGSKLVIIRGVDNVEVYNDIATITRVLAPTVFEATVVQNVPQVIYSSWYYGIVNYESNIVSGSFSTTQYDLGTAGSSNEVSFGGLVNQLEDALITELLKATVDAYTTIDNAQEFYDRAKSYLTDNYAGETETILTRSESTINARGYDVNIVQVGSAFAFNGTTITINANSFVGNIITTGLVTGKEFVTGFVFDNTQDSSVSDIGGNTLKVYASASDRDGRANAIAADVTSYSFVFASISANPLYFWVQSGNTELPTELTVVQGSNILDLGTGALIKALPIEVDKALASRIDGIDLPNIVAVATRTELNAELNLITANLDKQISTLNDFNPAASTVITDAASRNASKADVSALSTFDSATDTVTAGNMRGTDGANTVAPDNTKIGLIKTKVDTLVNTNLTGIALTTDITNLNDITASEVVTAMQLVKDDFKANVSALSTFNAVTDTVTAGNMRGTDNANTVIPDNTSISTILVDTNELQGNQNNWNTATGFSTFDNATDSVITDVASRNASKADVSALISSQAAQTVQITAIEAATNDISDFKGLTLGSPATFTPTGIVAGAKSVTITGNGITSTTVTRDA